MAVRGARKTGEAGASLGSRLRVSSAAHISTRRRPPPSRSAGSRVPWRGRRCRPRSGRSRVSRPGTSGSIRRDPRPPGPPEGNSPRERSEFRKRETVSGGGQHVRLGKLVECGQWLAGDQAGVPGDRRLRRPVCGTPPSWSDEPPSINPAFLAAPVPGSRCRCADYANRIEVESTTTGSHIGPTNVNARRATCPPSRGSPGRGSSEKK